MTLKTILEAHHITVADIAKECDVSTAQIYHWIRNGISRHNPHFNKLKEILPELQAKEITLKTNGEEDGRYKSGRKKKELKLSETDVIHKSSKQQTSTLFPTIKIKKKGG